MKSNFTTLGKVMAVLLLFSVFYSCKTNENVVNNSFIQKRKYNKGYHLSLRKNKNKVQEVLNNTPEQATAQTTVEKLTPIEGISAKMVASKKVNPLTSELVASKQNFIPQIAFDQKKNNPNVENLINLSTAKFGKKRTERLIKKAKKKLAKKNVPPMSGGKSQLVAFLLCFFLGGLGIHRFYLGYTWQGVVQLLTGGGCGIWVLIDFIRIIIGDLGPKDGGYDKTF